MKPGPPAVAPAPPAIESRPAPEHYWKYRTNRLHQIPMTLAWAREIKWNACLEKTMFESDREVQAAYVSDYGRGIFSYFCPFCHGWHATHHRYNEGYAAVSKAAARFLGRRPS